MKKPINISNPKPIREMNKDEVLLSHYNHVIKQKKLVAQLNEIKGVIDALERRMDDLITTESEKIKNT